MRSIWATLPLPSLRSSRYSSCILTRSSRIGLNRFCPVLICFSTTSESRTQITRVRAREILCGPLAFLLGVLFDQRIPFEQAWQAPLELKRRLGHIDPYQITAIPNKVALAVQSPPKLHRYVNNLPAWIVLSAKRVIRNCDSDASNIWPALKAFELRKRFSSFRRALCQSRY